jgi:putative resolvase
MRANDGRPKLLALLKDPTIALIVVEHQVRLTRFGFSSIETLLGIQGLRIGVVNLTENNPEDLIQDLVANVSSRNAPLCGQRRAKRNTGALLPGCKKEDTDAAGGAAHHFQR